MISIVTKAEEALANIIKDLKAGRHAQNSCCLHIRGLALGDHLFTQLPHLLDKWIGDPQGKILVCEDRDIFVFSDFLTPKFYTRFREMLNAQLGYEPTAENTVSAFYDGHAHAPALEAMAHEKIERIRAEKILEEEKRKVAALNAQVNAELVSTLARRRAARKALQIQVIEDDPFSRRMINLALKPEYEAAYADCGITGLRDYLALAPDILFLDINLPDVNGLDLLQKLIKIDPDAYIVMLSGNGNAENVMTAVKDGARGFVGKPFAREKLLQCIAKRNGVAGKTREA